MKIFGTSPHTNASSAKFGWSMSPAANSTTTSLPANQGLPSMQGQSIFTTSSPFALPPLQATPATSTPIAPLNLPFYNANSMKAQAGQFVSDVMAATNSKKPSQPVQAMESRQLTMAVPFNPSQWYASTSMLVVQLSPEVSVPSLNQSAMELKFKANQSVENNAVLSAASTNSTAQVGRVRNQPKTAIASNAPPIEAAITPAVQALQLSPFEQKTLGKALSNPTSDVFTSSGYAKLASASSRNSTLASRVGATLQSGDDYSTNPFAVLNKLSASPKTESAVSVAETMEAPDYQLQAYQRILRSTHGVPDEVLFTAAADHRLLDQPNQMVTYAYLPHNASVLTEPMIKDGVQTRDNWFAPALRFGAQLVAPLVQSAHWLNVAQMKMQSDKLWFGSRWNIPLVSYQDNAGNPAQLYHFTRLANGDLVQVVGNYQLDQMSLTPAFGAGKTQALDGAPQDSPAKTLADNLKMNATVKEANALTVPTLQSKFTADTKAYATAPVILSASKMSQEQPLFKGRAAYSDWIMQQAAQMETMGLAPAS